MMSRLLLLTHTLLLVGLNILETSALEAGSGKIVGCYFGSWSVYRPGSGKFDVEDIDPFLCTHAYFGFAGLGHDYHIRPLDPYNELPGNWQKGAYVRFTNLTRVNPQLKVILAIGGWNEGSATYSQMASTRSSRATFISSVVAFLNTYGFQGLDLDWEYPASRGGAPHDKANHAELLKELREEFDKHGLLLTAAVSAGRNTVDTAYDVPALARYLDIVNLMAYDFHGGWEVVTGHASPLYARRDETDFTATLNTDFAVRYWIQKGMPREKIALGVGLYGRGFTLADPTDHGLGASAPQGIQAGPYTRSTGFWGYNEICEDFDRNPSWTVIYETNTVAPYAFRGRNWIGYDDLQSVRAKGEYINRMSLGGGMVWSIDTDDFHGHCSSSKGVRFPMISALKDSIHANTPHPSRHPTQPTRAPITQRHRTARPTHPAPITTAKPARDTTRNDNVSPLPADRYCKKAGLNPDPAKSCSDIFYSCAQDGHSRWRHTRIPCPYGTVYDDNNQICDFPSRVEACQGHTTARPIPKTTKPARYPSTRHHGPDMTKYHTRIPRSTVPPGAKVTTVPPTVGPAGRYCPKQGNNPNPDEACSTIYYQCYYDGGNDWRRWKRTCPDGTRFNVRTGNCDFPRNIDSCVAEGITSAPSGNQSN